MILSPTMFPVICDGVSPTDDLEALPKTYGNLVGASSLSATELGKGDK